MFFQGTFKDYLFPANNLRVLVEILFNNFLKTLCMEMLSSQSFLSILSYITFSVLNLECCPLTLQQRNLLS